MYKCEQCDSECEVDGDGVNVVCGVCSYEIPKDTADKAALLAACEAYMVASKTPLGKGYAAAVRDVRVEIEAAIAKAKGE